MNVGTTARGVSMPHAMPLAQPERAAQPLSSTTTRHASAPASMHAHPVQARHGVATLAPAHHTTPPTPAPPKTLRVGDSGTAVSDLQQQLLNLGYAVDTGGTFTRETRHAVMAFQKVNGLIRDGIVGPQTRAALANPKQPDIGQGNAHRVVVDLSDQVAYVVNDGKLDFIVNVSTGNPQLPDGLGVATRTGTFQVYRRSAGTYNGSMGTIYWPAFFDGGIALHGSKNVPAYPASHGCVRIPMHLAERVYREASRGTQVIVRD